MGEPRVIKRYANRKLYDTMHSRYVTLEQIADMVREGEDVRIVDNTTKEDLTSVTLAQIILEEEKRKKSFLPLAAMRHIIQSGGDSIQELAAQAQAKVRSVFGLSADGTELGPDGQPLPEGTEPRPAAAAAAAATPEEAAAKPEGLRELLEKLEHPQKAFDDLQKKLDERVRTVIESVSPFAAVQRDLKELVARVGEIEKTVEDLKKR